MRVSGATIFGFFLKSRVAFAADVAGNHIAHSDTVQSYLANYGLSVEEHNVTTDDGYILMTHRLANEGAPVIHLQHGLLDSTWQWIDNSPELSLALRLYGLGYDVWMGNNRGNLFSNTHATMNSSFNKEYWAFSFSDMGRHDVPALVGYILNATNKSKLSYIGHSQGTAQMFVAMTDPQVKSQLADKVNLFIALSPIAYMKNQQVPLYKLDGTFRIGAILKALYPYGFCNFDQAAGIGNELCKITGGLLCTIGVDVAVGTTPLDTTDAILNITAHFPAGTSTQAIDHFEQLSLHDVFQDYDYGETQNQEKYGQPTAPLFNLSAASSIPTSLFIGGSDELADPIDIARLAQELPAMNVVYNKTFSGFGHITWIAGTAEAFEDWYPDAVSLLEKYNPLQSSVLV